jgi:hypothetical protein
VQTAAERVITEQVNRSPVVHFIAIADIQPAVQVFQVEHVVGKSILIRGRLQQQLQAGWVALQGQGIGLLVQGQPRPGAGGQVVPRAFDHHGGVRTTGEYQREEEFFRAGIRTGRAVCRPYEEAPNDWGPYGRGPNHWGSNLP